MTDAFESAQDCEDAFYDAFDEGDIEQMMACWAESDDVACVHPVREEITGRTAIRESWTQIFAAEVTLEIEIHHRHWIETPTMALHIVHEQLIYNGDRRRSPPPVIATNGYRKGESGWRMVLHHASPPPAPPPNITLPGASFGSPGGPGMGPPPGSATH
jgi:ketosteroid isomerase-like protein